MAILAIVSIVTALFVVRPLLRSTTVTPLPELPAPITIDQTLDSNSHLSTDAEDNVTFDGSTANFAPHSIPATLPSLDTSFNASDESPVQRLREMIENRQDETIDILWQWLEQKEKQNS